MRILDKFGHLTLVVKRLESQTISKSLGVSKPKGINRRTKFCKIACSWGRL